MTKSRYLLVPAVLAIAVAVAGCGGSSTAKLGATDVAVVGKTTISKTEFTDLMATAQQSFKSQGRPFPKPGTTEYESLKSQAVTLLVQQAEREEKAKSLGITVTDTQVQQRLDQIKKQYFGGNESRYQAQLKKSGLSDAQVRRDVRSQLVSEAIYNKVTAKLTVTNAEVHAYYEQNLKKLYTQPESRQVRHILVKTKALADSIYAQLKGGADFATLAKKYSEDPGSKLQGGKLTISKGQTVAPFDRVAFSLKTGQLSPPVHTIYGWHVIQAVGPIQPAKTTPESQVDSTIRTQLLNNKKSQAINTWLVGVEKQYCSDSHVRYQAGYRPNPDPCSQLPTTTAATTSTAR